MILKKWIFSLPGIHKKMLVAGFVGVIWKAYFLTLEKFNFKKRKDCAIIKSKYVTGDCEGIDFVLKILRDAQGIIFIRYEMPIVLRMRVFLVCKLSFRLLWRNSCTVRRRQMPYNACKRHLEFRYHM